MARRKLVNLVREIGPEERYGSVALHKLINMVMWRGKKNAARVIVYEAMDILLKKCSGDKEKALEMYAQAIDAITPTVEVRPRRVGGSVYQIPAAVNPARARSLAYRWLISAAASRSDKTMGLRLGYELLEALDGRGSAIKKRQDVHRMAESNKAFSHLSW